MLEDELGSNATTLRVAGGWCPVSIVCVAMCCCVMLVRVLVGTVVLEGMIRGL